LAGPPGRASYARPAEERTLTLTRDADELARVFARICAQAARPVMEVYAGDFTPEQKADRSPVTEADRRAEDVILKALAADMPGVPVLAEESFAAGMRPGIAGDFILVDPVDGTKEFISRNGEFTVNIALISARRPVAGCVFAPAKGRIYLGGASALSGPLSAGGDVDGAELAPISARASVPGAIPAVMSRSHADDRTRAFAQAAGVTDTVSAGSSLKFCLVAEGAADLYPRFAPTMEWDTAAGHAVLQAAGGSMLTPEGDPFLYGKTDAGYLNGFFIARGRG
jgi:3'(2'), 5'-bisphosphate nucleotidase